MTEYGCPGSIVVKELSFKREKKKRALLSPLRPEFDPQDR